MQDQNRTITAIMLLSVTLLGLHFGGCSHSDSLQTESSATNSNSAAKLNSQSSTRFVVYPSGNESLEDLARSIEAIGGQVVKTLKRQNALVALKSPSDNGALTIQAKSGGPKWLPDGIVTLIDPIKPEIILETIGQQVTPWGIRRVKAPEAHQIPNSLGEGVTVCIVDSGISRNHPDLAANIAGGKNLLADNEHPNIDPADFEDNMGHGSHVAGIIAAIDNTEGVVGVAPAAKLFIAKVFDKGVNTYDSNVAEAILECQAQGVQIINLSLGGAKGATESPMKAAIDQVIASGIIVVAAAGNESSDLQDFIPASYDGVFAVAATNKHNRITGFSNFGLDISDLSAPGKNIKSTWKGQGYARASGTSMAAPHVSGVMALAISSSSLGIKTQILMKKGNPIPETKQGAGLIDALATVENSELPPPEISQSN